MNTTLRSSLAAPLRQSTSLLRAQLLAKPIQRTLTTTTPTIPVIPHLTNPIKSRYTQTERRLVGLATFMAGNACIGTALYYYVSQSEGHIAGSYAKKNARIDRMKYDGRLDTKHLFPFTKVA